MCRIAGIVSKSFSDNKENQLLLMRDAMHRGGPDDAGIYIDKQFPIALAHRRLSIIDLSSAGHQPMLSNDQQIIISFNGEIYNYIELRNELKNLGHVFKTETDTEVIIAGYIQWRTAVFAKLNGMFAIAIFDKNTQELILARDHAGIKPLYISVQENEIYFASEIRASPHKCIAKF
jgi:asparagine synthase (glutamine-hydrolysing)